MIINPDQLKYNDHVVKAEKAAEDGELLKVVKYSPIITATNSLFSPMVIEIYGRMGPQSRKLFNDLTLKLMSTGAGSSFFDSLGKARQYFRARLLIATHRGLAHGFLCRIADILYRRQHINLFQDDSDSIDIGSNNNNPLLIDNAFE
jgi:hypothetical protein